MMLAYNVSSWHISTIGKPFNWGFLFLGASRGLSWYWSFKIIAMLLLAYEFAMILTSSVRLLSAVSSFWITFHTNSTMVVYATSWRCGILFIIDNGVYISIILTLKRKCSKY